MIIVDKNKATMAGPDELIECEAMIFVVMSDEEAEKRARENKNKLSREENEMLNKFIHLMFS